jgi:hypothetical protein
LVNGCRSSSEAGLGYRIETAFILAWSQDSRSAGPAGTESLVNRLIDCDDEELEVADGGSGGIRGEATLLALQKYFSARTRICSPPKAEGKLHYEWIDLRLERRGCQWDQSPIADSPTARLPSLPNRNQDRQIEGATRSSFQP